MILALSAVAAGCGGGSKPAPRDAEPMPPQDGGVPEQQPEVDRGPACGIGQRTCQGQQVRACGPSGVPEGPVIEDCGATGKECSAGRCTSKICFDAEMRRSNTGCRFYAIDADNTRFDDNLQFSLVVGNADKMLTATVKLDVKTGGAWTTMMTATLAPGAMQVIPLGDSHREGPGVFPGASFRIDSDVPIAAYAFNSDDQLMRKSESSGATMLIPAQVLGRNHLAMTAPMPPASVTPISGPSPAQIQVVAIHDQTTVKVTPKAALKAGGGLPVVPAGSTHSAVLDEGDLLQVQTAAEGGDLTASEIWADKPIAVFSGNVCSDDGHGIGFLSDPCDMNFEQIFPVEAWGMKYVASRVLPQDTPVTPEGGCSKWGPPPLATTWRIMASEDGTTVRFDARAGVAGVPTSTVRLNRGQFHELKVSGEIAAPGDFYVEADRAIMVAQFVPCQPSLGHGVPVEQMLKEFTFFAPSFFSNQLIITRRQGANILLNGMPIPARDWVDAGGGFEVIRQNAPNCLGGAGASCVHTVSGGDIGVLVRGMDGHCSYLYMGGVSMKCLNKTVGCR